MVIIFQKIKIVIIIEIKIILKAILILNERVGIFDFCRFTFIYSED